MRDENLKFVQPKKSVAVGYGGCQIGCIAEHADIREKYYFFSLEDQPYSSNMLRDIADELDRLNGVLVD
jgi:hypothetical protein